ncbi:MAG: DNA primase [Paludibacteraceae bacterium]|nr:DNA primase [Paludibacteraceae bacterium]
MIDPVTVDKIFEAADIVSVVSDYVSLKRKGANYWGNCPFHEEKTPSFSVSPAKNIYKCFGCGKGGNSVNFIMGVENLSYYEALLFLAKKYHIEVKEKELSDEEVQQQNEKESLMSLTEWAQKHFTENLQSPEGQSVGMSYLAHRGFREDIIKKFQLGYALDKRDEYTIAAQKAGYKLDYLEKTGLTIVKENNYMIDRFHGRVIFPIHSISGRVVAFGGRAIKKDEVAKYQNSPESDIYHKSYVLYGLYFAKSAITKKKKCYIVEGYADVISMVQAGIENIVAPCGTALTTQQIQQLRRILPSADAERSDDKNVTLLYDGDGAGMHAALKNGKMLLEEGLNVKVVVLPEPEDPDSFAQNHDSSEVARYLEENEQDYVVFKINHYLKDAQKDPMKMSQLIEDVASTIEVIPDEVKRSVYISMAAKMLNTEERILCSRVNQINKKKVDEAAGPSRADVISQMQSVDVPPTEEPAPVHVDSMVEKLERELLCYIVRFGEYPVAVENPETGEKDTIPVVEYIKDDLEVDGLSFQNPLYQGMMMDYFERYQQDQISSSQFFIRNTNPDYVSVAADAMSDPYPLSKIFNENETNCRIKVKKVSVDASVTLVHDLNYSLLNYKSHWLSNLIVEKTEKLRNNQEEEGTLIAQIQELMLFKKEIDKRLGERHIHP